jgi:hypothetical protein
MAVVRESRLPTMQICSGKCHACDNERSGDSWFVGAAPSHQGQG